MNVGLASASDTMEASMNSVIGSSFFINFLISFSMKKLLEAIRVLQIIAFFSFIEINYPPISMLFLQSMYKFTTFKVVPEDFMDKAMTTLGIKDDSTAIIEEESGERLLQESAIGTEEASKGSTF